MLMFSRLLIARFKDKFQLNSSKWRLLSSTVTASQIIRDPNGVPMSIEISDSAVQVQLHFIPYWLVAYQRLA